jgi:hypothetical protein
VNVYFDLMSTRVEQIISNGDIRPTRPTRGGVTGLNLCKFIFWIDELFDSYPAISLRNPSLINPTGSLDCSNYV